MKIWYELKASINWHLYMWTRNPVYLTRHNKACDELRWMSI